MPFQRDTESKKEKPTRKKRKPKNKAMKAAKDAIIMGLGFHR